VSRQCIDREKEENIMNTEITINNAELINAVEAAYGSCYGSVEEALVKGGVPVDDLPDNHTGISIYREDDGSLTVIFYHDDVYEWKERTGHLYYGSPYESCDSCGNCDGGKCDFCREVVKNNIQKVEKGYLRRFVARK
jgi:hypothetical protein